MGDKTAIEWTDATWNPVVGCSIVSPGCTNCYAMKQAHGLERRFGSEKYSGLTRVVNGNPVWTGTVRLDEKALDQPLRWKRGRRIFVNSMSDLFHEALPDEAIERVFAIMALAPQHTFQVLTKRADRMKDWAARTILAEIARMHAPSLIARGATWPLPNVWLGVSVEDQARADERIQALLQTPAALRFLSCEPLLGPLDLDVGLRVAWQCSTCQDYFSGRHRPTCPACGQLGGWSGSHAFNPPGGQVGTGIGWVIAGGESGPRARPMHPDWARSLRDQCARAGVPFFFKQWGEYRQHDQAEAQDSDTTVGEPPSAVQMIRAGKKAAGRLLDGRTHDELPG